MKKYLKICILIVIIVLTFSACAPAGGNLDENGNGFENENKTPSSTVSASVRGDVSGGTHIYSVADTDKNWIENGVTEYKILTANTMSEQEKTAVIELKNLILESTGVTLESVSDSTVDGKYISIGKTALFNDSDIQLDYQILGSQGFRIKTIGDNIYICGYGEYGTLYGVYEFLYREIGFDHYFTDMYYIDKNVEKLSLKNYDITDVPDFEYRAPGYGYVINNKTNLNRMRLINTGDLFIPVGGSLWHNTFSYLPPEKYKKDHPKWYSTDGTQLSYTARGDDAEKELMIEEVIKVMKNCFISSPDKNLITFSIQDTQTFCSYDTAVAKEKYGGANSSVIIIFLNEVAEEIEQWMQSDEGKPYARDFHIMFFAYHATNKAPVKYDETTGTYLPVSDDVILNDHVNPYFAETNGDYTQNFDDAGTANTEVAENMKGWTAISKALYFWNYATNFKNYLVPYNSFGIEQDIYKFAFEQHADFIFTQGQHNQSNGATGWSVLKQYLESKLGWNVNVDVDKLTQQFFDYVYGDASQDMLSIYKEYRAVATLQTEEMGFSGSRSIFINGAQSKFWSKYVLKDWISRMNSAKEKLLPLKEQNQSLYIKRINALDMEKLSYLYLYITLYGNTTDSETLNGYKSDFVRIISATGISKPSENEGTMAELLASWGL